MRSPVLVLALSLVALPLAAQRGPTDKGSILVSGAASISRSEVDVSDVETEVTRFSLNPNLLFFVIPQLAVGGEFSYSRSSVDDNDSSAWSLGPAARLFFSDVRSTALPYVGAGFAFGSADNGSNNDSGLFAVSGVAGVAWMVSRQVGITSEVFLQRSTIDIPQGSTEIKQKQLDYGLRFGFAAFVF